MSEESGGEVFVEESGAEVEESVEESGEFEASEEGYEGSEEQLQDQVEEAIENGATQEEVQNLVEEFVLKVNGREVKKTVDWNDKEGIKRELQKAAAYGQTAQEAAELKKLFAQELNRLKTNPWDVMQELGMDPDELAEMRIQQRIEDMKKSPEQIEKERYQKELEEARRKLKEHEERALQEERQRLDIQAAQELDDDIMQAIDSHGSLPTSPRVIKQMAETMLWAMNNGFEDVKAADVLPTVERELKREIEELMSALPEEMFESYIGRKNMDRLRKKRVAKLKKTNNVSNLKKESKPKPQESKPSKPMSFSDFMRRR